ncbi:MAG: hypothetical protein HY207_06475 [Nitrospirae bacterium]|nr:hypothetical protein [Nitrospirota bacterium]
MYNEILHWTKEKKTMGTIMGIIGAALGYWLFGWPGFILGLIGGGALGGLVKNYWDEQDQLASYCDANGQPYWIKVQEQHRIFAQEQEARRTKERKEFENILQAHGIDPEQVRREAASMQAAEEMAEWEYRKSR